MFSIFLCAEKYALRALKVENKGFNNVTFRVLEIGIGI